MHLKINKYITMWAIIQPSYCKYSSNIVFTPLKNTHPWKCSRLKNIHPWKIPTLEKYSPPSGIRDLLVLENLQKIIRLVGKVIPFLKCCPNYPKKSVFHLKMTKIHLLWATLYQKQFLLSGLSLTWLFWCAWKL